MSFLSDIVSDVSAFSNPFGAPSAGQWNLSKGMYTSSTNKQLVFFVESKAGETNASLTALEQITDGGGRRVAIYEYPYVDGQQTADLGRKGETYTFNIKFHGNNYQQKYRDFLNIVAADSGVGTLTHPVLSAVRGEIKVKFQTYENVHRHDEWNAITIKATFIEDNTTSIASKNTQPSSSDSFLRNALQLLTTTQAAISAAISDVNGLLLLPSALKNSFLQRLNSIVSQVSRLLGQLAATFSSNATLQALAAQAAATSNTIPSLSGGSVSSNVGGTGTISQLPPVYQVGFSPTALAAATAQISNYVNSNTITPQQAVFVANQIRTLIVTAIAELSATYGNAAYDIILSYKGLAITIQQAVESAIAASQTQVMLYTTPTTMSLRMVAFKNGLLPERQNDIEALNPYLPSVNYIPAGTQLVVPAS